MTSRFGITFEEYAEQVALTLLADDVGDTPMIDTIVRDHYAKTISAEDCALALVALAQ